VGCGCGNKTKYRVTKGDGRTVTVNSLAEARALVRSFGGSYVKV
jgi:hypothetical protein